MSDRSVPPEGEEPPPEGIEEPEAAAAVEAAAWAALVALLGAAAAAVIVEGLVDLSLWPSAAWDPTEILTEVGRVYARQFGEPIPPAEGAPAPPVREDTATHVAEWIAERENLLVAVDDDIFNQVRDLVDAATAEGMSEAELTGYVREVLNPNSPYVDWRYRAQRIARTEVHTAEQAGQYGYLSQQVNAGLIAPPRLAWLNAGDMRVRPGPRGVGPFDHHNIASVTWPEPFIVSGESLRFPGDPSGSAGNVINCRCAFVRIP